MEQQTFSLAQAAGITRVFCGIERAIASSLRSGDQQNANAMARILGGLYWKLFQQPFIQDGLGVDL